MRCIFCKKDSSNSRSVEHIVPESLGNKNHILPKGVVCDTCNNYFAIKIEKPFLESGAITTLRFNQGIPNKKDRIPKLDGIINWQIPVTIKRESGGPLNILYGTPIDDAEKILRSETNTLIFPASGLPPNDQTVSRLLAKMSLEALAQRLISHEGGLEYIIDETQLDPIRNHARRGQVLNWPYYIRRIYHTDLTDLDENGNIVQTIFEYDLLQTESSEWYFIFALFGLELAINMGGPYTEGYKSWLEANNNLSPLYSKKVTNSPSHKGKDNTSH